MRASTRKRRVSGEVLQLVVRGEGNSEPSQCSKGVQEVKKWLDMQLNELQVS